MKCSLLEQKLAAPRAHAPLDRRYAERALIHHEVTYTGTEGARFTTSIGSLKDLSKTGCKILGTTLPVIGPCHGHTVFKRRPGALVSHGCNRILDQRACVRRAVPQADGRRTEANTGHHLETCQVARGQPPPDGLSYRPLTARERVDSTMEGNGMKHTSTDRSRRTADKPSDDNRRGTERVPTQFSLMYSGCMTVAC